MVKQEALWTTSRNSKSGLPRREGIGQGEHAPSVYRRKRTRFSTLHRHALEKAFNKSCYLTPFTKQMLQELGIPKRTIKIWFKNRRVKWRNEMRKWESVKNKPVTENLCNNMSQPASSANHRSLLTLTANLHSEAQNTQPSAMVSTMCQGAKVYRLCGYTEIGMSAAANSLDSAERTPASHVTWSFSRSQSQLAAFTETEAVLNKPGMISQRQHTAHSSVSWIDNFPDPKNSFQSTAPWTATAGHVSDGIQTLQSGVPLSTAPWMSSLSHLPDTNLKQVKGGTPQMDQSGGSLSIATTGHVSDGNQKLALDITSQISLQDWEVEARLNDLMDIIARDGFIASPELNSPR